MVKIQEILQRIMGNRGSKSSNVIAFFVKEQRIDGSHIGVWTTNKKKYIISRKKEEEKKKKMLN